MRKKIYLTEDNAQGNPGNTETPQEFDDSYEYLEEEDYIDAGNDQGPGGLFSTPARTVTLLFSMLLLLVIGSTVIWLASSRSSPAAAGPGAGAGASSPVNTSGLDVAARTGALAPDFTLIDVHTHKPVKLSSLRGKPVFINFWGTWCPPCRAEMPEMQKLYDKYKGNYEQLGISMGPRDDESKVQLFVDVSNYNWTFIHDPDYSVATTYQVQAVPSSYFIDKDGVIRAVQVGAMNQAQMEHNLQLTH